MRITAVLCFLAFSIPGFAQRGVVTATQANGTYRYKANEIKILALGHNKLKIQMELAWEYTNAMGRGANVGESYGEATIDNDVATFRPEGTEDCTVTIKFLPRNRIQVSEDHVLNCGWGFNVSSEGSYRKVRAGKPKFETDR